MVVAVEMAKDGNARILLHPRHKAFATARHDEIDSTGKTFQHKAHGVTISRLHYLDRGLRKSSLPQAFAQALGDGGGGMEAIGTAA